eukprot:TRINITY_DN107080_c0_g1_i1.p1 TRINITY_DN107080_c0_g1~~TRINITY_DN107080_c0_g1_i1.p1  ORF type:complete len:409 (-),score=64.85 TRINITY_DN107080_c0_g1_i1:191-1417(-)
MGCGSSQSSQPPVFCAEGSFPAGNATAEPVLAWAEDNTIGSEPSRVSFGRQGQDHCAKKSIAQTSTGGEWQIEESPEHWVSLGLDTGRKLTEAYYSGQSLALYSVRGAHPSQDADYEVSFRECVQTNRKTGVQQRIRWHATSALTGAGHTSDLDRSPGAHETHYQWELKNGAWADFEDEEERYFVVAWMAGKDVFRYSARGFEYEINFPRMWQSNITTGQKRHIRVKRADATDRFETAGQTPTGSPTEDTTAEARHVPEAGRGGGQSQARRSRPDRPQPARAKRFTLGAKGSETASAPGQGAAEATEKPPPMQGQSDQKPAEAKPPSAELMPLPSGASWPASPEAREAARALFADLCEARRSSPPAERRRLYKASCLAWHPDKNLDCEDVATEVFKFLQLLRDWLVSD